ncbi:MAG: GPR endopeptidase [Ruminococcus sp.]|nr:GPR endopeptidase [Ruminococcus sp.]
MNSNGIRTDLALECFPEDEGYELPEGVTMSRRGEAFRITEIDIADDSCMETLGKGKGRYITLEGGELSRFSPEYSDMAQELAGELGQLVPEGDILVAGIGNSDITPDAVGPQTAARVLATRHLQSELAGEDMEIFRSLRRVSVLAAGVLGQTGIETAELLRTVCGELRPAAVIAVDALACSDISRLGTVIQLSDSGISPGSGVANSRRELSERTLGVPVIAAGVPTVADLRTIVRSFTGQSVSSEGADMIVTPRDIDRLTERASQLLAFGINLALHPALSFEDVRGLF